MQRQFRLRQARDYQRVRHEGRAYTHSWLILSTAANSSAHNRYGFITAKRLGSAVIRNRIRRQLREAVRHLHPRLKPGYDVVIIARHAILGQPYAAIQRILMKVLVQAGLVVEDNAL